MNKKFFLGLTFGVLFFVLLSLLLFLPGPKQTQDGRLPVVASFYPLYFFSSEIGGNKADVANITPAGAEPHDYEPTAGDMIKVENSKLLVLNGDGLEAWANNLKQAVNAQNTNVVIAGEGLANQTVAEGSSRVVDPHIWLSPPLAEKMVEKIAQGFETSDPTNAEYYASNAAALESSLSSLDAEYKSTLANCKEKDIITSHAAFGYLASTYGLTQIPIAGLSPDAEPSSKQLADIAKFAKANNIKYIFFESLVSPKLSDTLANEIGAKTLVLDPIEGLTENELNAGENYITKMKSNLNNLAIALECNK